MPKRMTIHETKVVNLLKGLVNIKAKGKEDEFIKKVKEKDKNLGKHWDQWKRDSDSLMDKVRQTFLKYGKTDKAKEVEDLMKQYNAL